MDVGIGDAIQEITAHDIPVDQGGELFIGCGDESEL